VPVTLRPPFFGGAYILVATRTVPVIGVAAFASAAVAGQLIGSLLLDQMGAFGNDRHELDLGRIVGVVLLLVGAKLVIR